MPTRTFLDSGVLIAAFRGQEPLASLAFQIIDDPGREFVVTDILRLELIPKAVYEHQEDEVKFYNDFVGSAADIPVTPQSTSAALSLAERYGLNACDALHVQAACEGAASEFITTERPEKPFFRVNENGLTMISLAQPLGEPPPVPDTPE